MLKSVVRHEILLNLVSFRFLLIVGLFVILSVCGLLVSIDSYKSSIKAYTEVTAATHRVTGTGKDPWTLAIPPNPLGAFATGMDKSSAVEVVTDALLTDYTVKPLGDSDVSTRLSTFPALDTNFVVKVVMSLAAILITFASVSGERYDGTLKLASASGASRKNLIVGKLLASFICLAVPLLTCTIISCLILALNNMLITSTDIVRVGLFTVFSLIYILFFLLVGLTISIFTKRPPESLVTGVLCWLVLVFIVPSLIPQVSKLFVKLPSARAMEQSRKDKWSRALFEMYSGKTPAENLRSVLHNTQTEHDADWEVNRNQISNYVRVNRWLALLSPSDIYNSASMEIVGNGVQNAIHAKKSILQHKTTNLAVRERRNVDFTFERMGFASDLMVALASMFILCLEAIVLLLFAYKQFMRLDLREG
ncbi:MAG: ABC transporter permease [Holophagaceae bacterium]|nr:ABC transporter permease [Holophagaceae bacterium]